MSEKKIEIKQRLDQNPEQYLDLWKWFTDDAGKIKDRMWTMASFFYTLLAALLAYVGKMMMQGDKSQPFPQIDQLLLLVVISIIGVSISLYAKYMIRQYGEHIRSGWNRADYIRFRVEGLSEILCFGDLENIKDDEKLKAETPKSLPGIAKRLINILKGFFLIFTLIFVWAIYLLVS